MSRFSHEARRFRRATKSLAYRKAEKWKYLIPEDVALEQGLWEMRREIQRMKDVGDWTWAKISRHYYTTTPVVKAIYNLPETSSPFEEYLVMTDEQVQWITEKLRSFNSRELKMVRQRECP